LYIQNPITEQNAINNELALSELVLAACEDTVKQDQFSSFSQLEWFNTANFSNQFFPTISSLQMLAPFGSVPQATINSGSILGSNANFSHSQLDPSFFENVPFKGAFGSEDWTTGWANWDPQNTAY
jgi:hypothetical protein